MKLGSRVAARFAGAGLSGELPQLKGQAVALARLGELPYKIEPL